LTEFLEKLRKSRTKNPKGTSLLLLLNKVFHKKKLSAQKGETISFSSGDVITEMTNGANLVNGSPTWYTFYVS